MSYEGYERTLCARGHLHEFDCCDAPSLANMDECEWLCPDCSSFIVWWESVDTTNGGNHRTDLQVAHQEKRTICECCGHSRLVEKERYCIPHNTGHRLNTEILVEVPVVNCEKIGCLEIIQDVNFDIVEVYDYNDEDRPLDKDCNIIYTLF